MTMARVIFAGTPEFAVPTLESLAAAGFDIVCVLTQPDRRQGRGQKFAPPAVKRSAGNLGLPVQQVHRIRSEVTAQVQTMQADLMVVVAFGMIVPSELLDAPRLGCVNVHPSLLPRWRGAAPIQRAIEAGDQKTGVTIMQMDSGIDTGQILSQVSCPIEADDFSASLQLKLADMGARELCRMMPFILNQELKPVEQNESESTYAKKLTRAEAEIDWTKSAESIVFKVRALNPWPVAHTWISSDRIQIWNAQLSSAPVKDVLPGEVIDAGNRKVVVAAGDGAVRLREVQKIGKKRLPVETFLNGHPIRPGSIFYSKRGRLMRER